MWIKERGTSQPEVPRQMFDLTGKYPPQARHVDPETMAHLVFNVRSLIICIGMIPDFSARRLGATRRASVKHAFRRLSRHRLGHHAQRIQVQHLKRHKRFE